MMSFTAGKGRLLVAWGMHNEPYRTHRRKLVFLLVSVLLLAGRDVGGLGEAEGKLAVVQLRSLLSSGLRDALPAARKAVSTAEDFRRFSGAESEA